MTIYSKHTIRDGDKEKGGIRNGYLLLDKTFCSTCPSRDYGVFHCAGLDSLSEVSEEKVRLNFKKKEMVFHAQEIVTGFYCIEKGLVRTYKANIGARAQTFQLASRGKWIGFRDAIAGADYNHSAMCMEDTVLCYIPKETILRLIKVDPSFQLEVMKYLAEEWKVVENNVHSLGTKQIHSRLADLLITFSDAANKDSELTIDVTREVMATCIGTTKETLIRSLSDFKDRKWIGIDKNKIELLNRKVLSELAEVAS
ncbi:MAG: Crp/Fnr family transcriptional regulator [Leptospiraceae bacterium]|nr:Crp/Fnr family transcriptional regulator [Leptospiraceae bacterium]